MGQHQRNPSDFYQGLPYGPEYDYEPHHRGAGRGAGGHYNVESGFNNGEYYPSPPYSSHRMMDMRDPTLQHSPRVRTSNRKKPQAKPAREFEGVRSLGLTPTNKAYHDP